jgi:RND family efflux transporter MFP subunit
MHMSVEDMTANSPSRRRTRRRNLESSIDVLLTMSLVVALASIGPGCRRPDDSGAEPAPKVSVARPLVREVVEWDEYTGRLQALDAVEVRPRVGGYVDSIHFADGTIVKEGDLLFIIDPRPYEATLKQARAEVEVAQSRLDVAKSESTRAERLRGPSAISAEEVERREATLHAASASLAAAQAASEAAALDVEFTRVVAPIAGRAGRHLVDEGNLVTGGTTNATLLTTIVSLDPIHCYFDADERQYLKYTRLAQRGERPSSRDVNNPVEVGLADEAGFPHKGWMDFVDNQLDTGTGTIIGRAIIPNPDRLLSPGLFVRVRIPGSSRHQVTLLPEEAIATDLNQTFVWVVDGENKAQYRRVTLGPLHEGLRIVRDGIGPDDRVVVAGMQRVRVGLVLAPEERSIEPPPALTAGG